MDGGLASDNGCIRSRDRISSPQSWIIGLLINSFGNRHPWTNREGGLWCSTTEQLRFSFRPQVPLMENIQEQPQQQQEGVMKSSRFKRVCVFCGSSPGKNPSYQLAAVELGKQLVERNIDLVYGGGSIGLMGQVSKAVYDGGRHVLGVMPLTLMPREITGDPVGEVRAVSGMHQRKAEMARQADAFVALPGTHFPSLIVTSTLSIEK
ncbi:PREDICTED: probable cytokinin riboside 5'-monophosphate phosphoribohydrolase LOGL6-like isoform 2 [Fragaria vesca subsp. vesca]